MKKSARGFTFIELMVTVTIGLLLTAGGLAAYRGVGSREKVKQEGYAFLVKLRAIQQKALSGEKPSGCLGDLDNYRVAVNPSLISYTVQAECLIVNGDTTEISLQNEVSFREAFSDIVFHPLRSDIDKAQIIIFDSKDGGVSYQVSIEQGGVIRGEML